MVIYLKRVLLIIFSFDQYHSPLILITHIFRLISLSKLQTIMAALLPVGHALISLVSIRHDWKSQARC